MAVCQEWDKQDFNFQRHKFGKSFHIRALKQFLFEKMRRIDLLWEIVKYRENLLCEFCCFNVSLGENSLSANACSLFE
jgi:hypothetical protein